MKINRKLTAIQLPPDLRQWLEEITDPVTYPLAPTKTRIIVEALRAYRGVVELRKGEFVPRRSDAAILAQKERNEAKLKRKR